MPLREFAQDKALMEEVQNYFYGHLDQLALEKVYKNEPTFGIADAKVAIENGFTQLDALFDPDKKKPPINPAR